jgi:hypothetical protein
MKLVLCEVPLNMYWKPGVFQVIGPTLELKCTGPGKPGEYSECPIGAYAKFLARFRELKLRAACEQCLRVQARAYGFTFPERLPFVEEA